MSEFNVSSYMRQLEEAATIDVCPKVPIPPIQANQNYLFISYSHKDYAKVYADLAHLYDRGIRFWYDKGLRAGKAWEKEVEEHIKDPRCCGVIFYLSTNMFLSDSVLKEIGFTRTRKRANHISQKNYFCVNLQEGSISDLLFEAQSIKQRNGLPLLDTNVMQILTSTFSDSATYIRYTSPFHVEELIEQIQLQFDVTNKPDTSPQALHAIQDNKAALRAFFGKETALLPLCKYLQEAFRSNVNPHSRLLIPGGILAGLAAAAAAITEVAAAQDAPFMPHLTQYLSMEQLLVLTGMFSLLYSPYLILKVYWLFYLSPVRKKGDAGTQSRVIHTLLFLCLSALMGFFSVPLCLSLILMAGWLVSAMKTANSLFP